MNQLLILVASDSRQPAGQHHQFVFLMHHVRDGEILISISISGERVPAVILEETGRITAGACVRLPESGGG